MSLQRLIRTTVIARVSSRGRASLPARNLSASFRIMSNEQSSSESDTQSKQKSILALPSASDATQIDVSSGQGVAKLDHLGPMVVNTDGTLSRITNWENMTEFEQKNTLRIISKRNKERLAALKAAGVEASEKNEGSS